MPINPFEIRNWVIYKIENPDKSVYIGRSCNFDVRAKWHLKVSRKSIKTKNAFLLASLQKYGQEFHTITILESLESNQYYADGKEIFWVRSYMANRNKWPEMNGLNLTDGGSGILGYKHKSISKIKMSIAKSKIIHTKEWVENAAMGRWRPILQFDLSGNFIKEFQSIKAAKTELCNWHGIDAVLRGRRKQTKGFVFKYKL